MMNWKHNEKYMDCVEIPAGKCGALQCSTCMYRDNERTADGFRRSEYDTEVRDWCVKHPRKEKVS